MARLLLDVTGRACAMLPTSSPEAVATRRGGAAGTLVYGVFGDARAGKNLHILPEALECYLGREGRGDFSISVTPTDAGLTDSLVALHELGRAFPERVRVSTATST